MPDKNTTTYKLLIISLLGAVFIVYINIAYFQWEFKFLDKSEHLPFILFFIYRYIFFWILIWILMIFNLRKIQTPAFKPGCGRLF